MSMVVWSEVSCELWDLFEDHFTIVSIVRVRRTRTRRTGYAHPTTWILAGRLVGAASKMIANATLS